MLPKKHRLPAYKIPEVLQKGSRQFSFLFTLFIVKQEQPALTRLTIIVPKKIDKRSSQRNRIKRLIREAVRDKLTKLKKGYDIIILAKKTAQGKGLVVITQELNLCLKNKDLL